MLKGWNSQHSGAKLNRDRPRGGQQLRNKWLCFYWQLPTRASGAEGGRLCADPLSLGPDVSSNCEVEALYRLKQRIRVLCSCAAYRPLVDERGMGCLFVFFYRS